MTSFNTSHVSINQPAKLIKTNGYRFNTSHVSINLGIKQQFFHTLIVSIHLMFLLISAGSSYAAAYNQFQYISCFY